MAARQVVTAFLLIFLPAIAAAAIAIASVNSAVRGPSRAPVLLAIPIVFLSAIALLSLWAMFNGAWATYLPYLAIALALVLLLAQLLAGRRRQP